VSAMCGSVVCCVTRLGSCRYGDGLDREGKVGWVARYMVSPSLTRKFSVGGDWLARRKDSGIGCIAADTSTFGLDVLERGALYWGKRYCMGCMDWHER
jgi:hypothetical protein